MTADDMVSALGAAGCRDGVLAVVRSTFELMEVAEREIASAKRRHPGRIAELDAAFLLLRPTEVLGGRERAYAPHARELLDRVAAGADTRPGTCAEVACALLEASLRAPLKDEAMAVLAAAWRECFPESDTMNGIGELWAGQAAEATHDARRKLAQDWRR